MSQYKGDVCYLDGWHRAVTVNEGGEVLGRKLVPLDGGGYRYATKDDVSWHEQHHASFVTVEMEDSSTGTRVTPEEFDAIQQLLRDRRGA